MQVYHYINGGPGSKWSKNWGDAIGPTIIKHFCKSDKLVFSDERCEGKLVSIGSVMLNVRKNDLIWGTGTIIKNQILPELKDVTVFATRGPKTRDWLLHLGHEVPEVYGDPGLLYSQIYNPEIEKTHEWGIIPHYVDVDHPAIDALIKRGVKFIDICAGEQEFVDQLKSVEKVLSSSLHGLIAADMYGIPNARVNLTGKVMGGDWKFEDYSISVKRELFKGTQLTGDERLEDIPLNFGIDWDPNPLLEAAPWNHPDWKHMF